MLKIGDFSRVAHVTVKALRHYGQKGLLRPVWVDRFSGYRYYSLEQLPRLNRILALKEMGFSLEQVGSMLDQALPADELRSILRQKRAEIEDHLRAEQMRLALLERRIEQIDETGNLAAYEIALKCVAEQVVVSRREIVPERTQLGARTMALRRQLLEELAGLNVRPSGGWTIIVHDREYAERNVDLELAIPVDLPAMAARRGARRKQVRLLPGLPQVACVLHAGAGNDLSSAYAALFTWLETNPWRQAGPVREVCHSDPADNTEGCTLVELQLPVEALHAPSYSPNGQESKEMQTMELKLIEKPAFMVVGMKYVGRNENQEIGEMWGRFNQASGAIAQDAKGWYGVCTMLEGFTDGTFEYLACVELEKIDKVPDWAVVKMVPANTYAVFSHRGPVTTMPETYHSIYQTWLPQSEFVPSGGYDMEVYTDEFNGTPDSVMYIYVPVKKKNA